jgi:hypothetical protein
MAWNAGSFTLSPGTGFRVYYGWGDDHGVQFALPLQVISNIGPPVVNNNLMVTAYGTARNPDGLSVTYILDMNNEGPGTSSFTLVGFGDEKTGVA